MIFKIFQLRQQMKQGQEIFNDPAGAAKGAAKGIIWGYLINFIITTVLIYGGLFVLGFTELLGGPYGFFKVLFIILAIPLAMTLIMGISFYRNIKKGLSGTKKSTRSSGDVIDVEVNQ